MTKQTDLLAKKVPKKPYPYALEKDPFSIPLPLVVKVPIKDKFNLRKQSWYKVLINPTDPITGTIESMIYHINGNEDLHGIIQWKKDIKSIITRKTSRNPKSWSS